MSVAKVRIVSNTTPIWYLVQIGESHLLTQLYHEIRIPPAVELELSQEKSPARVWMTARPAWLSVEQPQPTTLQINLDPGESEAIALAIELKCDLLLMDEIAGRAVAKAQGLRTTGTLGIILEAAEQKFIDGWQAIEKLEKTNFFATAKLYEIVKTRLRQIR